MPHRRFATTLFALVLIAACKNTASASSFTISGGGQNGCGGSFGAAFGPESSSTTIFDQASGPCLDGTMTVSAISGPGFLGGRVFNTYGGVGNASLASVIADLSGFFTIVDPVDEVVGVSMNLFINSTVQIVGQGGGGINIDLFTTFGDGHFNWISGSTGAILIPTPGSSALVTTPTLFLQTNTPQVLNISLNLLAGAPFAGFVDLDYAHTLSFSPISASFTVPQGLTVESQDLNIFNNQWVDPRLAGVPEPGSLSLASGAILAIIIKLRLERRK